MLGLLLRHNCRTPIKRAILQPTYRVGGGDAGLGTNVPRYQQYMRAKSLFNYLLAVPILVAGLGFAAVPLYRMFCQATGYGGTTQLGDDLNVLRYLKPVKYRKFKIFFNADTEANFRWGFRPEQPVLVVRPGETALAFFKAVNNTDEMVMGISSYNVVPYEAGPYFMKVQCFCFDEQPLNAHEEVDLPVFFYLDPSIAEDPLLENMDTITLSYTFYEAREGWDVPIPEFMLKNR